MLNDDNSNQPEPQSRQDWQTCCPGASDRGRKMWKTLIFVAIVTAAGVVLARSLMSKPDSTNEAALWGPELDSLASLDEVATEVDAVFILIAGRNQQDAQTLTGEIEAATKSIRSRGNRISAFRLKKDATDYENMAEQFSVPTVMVMVKGLGYSAVSDQITEANLIEAFVTASQAPAGCCPPGTDPSVCDAMGCGPSDPK
ncbi:MAG: hypothetical protein ACYST6_18150 [Planctomycetota bacterium]